MGFLSASCSFTRFRILDPVTDEIVLQIPDSLKRFAFQDIDNLPEMCAHGWVSFEDMLDNQWLEAPPQKGQYAVFSLRLDTRRIPPGVIKKHFALALKKEHEALLENNRKFIPRERKKEIREQVLLALRERFLPVPAEFNVLWNIPANEVWFASGQSKMIDLFAEAFLNTFGLHIEELTPFALAESLLSEEDAAQLEAIEDTQFTNPQRQP